jgi:N-acetylmuramic acid 6-phosphate etherase
MSSLPATERANEAAVPLDEMSTLQMLELINSEDTRVAAAVRAELPAVARAVDEVADRLRTGGRLILLGAGTSGRLALMQAAEAPPTFGIPPTTVISVMAGGPDALTRPIEGAEDDATAGAGQIDRLAVTGQDAVVGISASGRTPFVLGALAEAGAGKALTIGLCCDHPTPISDAVDIAIHPMVGPEVIAGSTRLKAGTAQKLVLDMLTTAVMARLGFVHSNLMIGVQGTNAKLRDRARRIVEQVTGRSGAPVEEALAASGWSARLAIVMLARGVDAAEARRLIETGRRLADLIGEEPRDG